jgi:carbamoylphosphate synthase large subunit
MTARSSTASSRRRSRTRCCRPSAGRRASTSRSTWPRAGVLDKHRVKLIGANVDAIRRAEDRDLFKDVIRSIGLDLPQSGIARSVEEAEAVKNRIGLP